MSHVANDRKLLSRIRRIKGQLEALERSVSDGEDCYKILQQTAAARGALNGLMTELIEGHLRSHTLQAKSSKTNVDREIKEVMTVIRSYVG
jgi:FrmR/RcnR family transcriptional regulator, repressor of frmRAB operon